MGNRGLITGYGSPIGIYLHWNGGRDSIEAFLAYAKLQGHCPRGNFVDELPALLTIIVNFFGNTGLNVYLHPIKDITNALTLDHGTYVIDNWTIVNRYHAPSIEQDTHQLTEMLIVIDERQPVHEQLGADYITAPEVPVSELNVGDDVYLLQDCREDQPRVGRYTVLGFGEKRFVGGRAGDSMPYINLYETGNKDNPNAYLRTETVRIPR